MHLRYDPLAETVMSGATSIHDVAQRDLDFIRRRMRSICRAWDHQRRYVLRMPDEMRVAQHFNPNRMPSMFRHRTCEVELVRMPRAERFPRFSDRRRAEEKAMRMMMAYNVGDVRLAMGNMAKMAGINPDVIIRNPVRMPPLDAPKPTPRARAKSVTWETGEEFVGRLIKRGYRVLGAGAYSTVLAKGNSKRVIKVNRKPDSWLDYVIWAAKNNHMGKNAPMVYSFRRFNEGTSDEFYVAVVERMKSTVSELPYGEQRASRLFGHLTAGMYGRVGSEHDALAADDMQPGSLRFAIQFKLAFRSDLDLHAGNFMVRDDGTVACTDPLCGDASGTAPSRWRHSSARLAV
ncbi:hypothetical protein [Bradyrhizobium sp. CCGB20]|uniref:hypothetical protein n=1 Tax=Bradyrhizobium sp. CCGB20 TaxID=2949633 RepID=UPI0020B31EF8|nr:hypothetical protein [Bradyrhizobium sp. CCGB20]MCP3400386.1 hypothetical protein [Bradyrhizobium sp. CCGB20]